VIAWNFINRDDFPPVSKNLAGSQRITEALEWATGDTLLCVKIKGEVLDGGNNVYVSTETELLWSLEANLILRKFARLCALDVIHLWCVPDVVEEYIKNGDENLRRDANKHTLNALMHLGATAAEDNVVWAARHAMWAAARYAAGNQRAAAKDPALWAQWGIARDAQVAGPINEILTEMVMAAHDNK